MAVKLPILDFMGRRIPAAVLSGLLVLTAVVNQTLGRTLVTSLTTLLVLLALLLAGGKQISGFATALTIGVIIGTWSSIYVAANVLLTMGITRQDLALPEKDALARPQ